MTINGRLASPLPPRAVVAILRASTAQPFIAASSVPWVGGRHPMLRIHSHQRERS
jgi:hypothetical protein